MKYPILAAQIKRQFITATTGNAAPISALVLVPILSMEIQEALIHLPIRATPKQLQKVRCLS